MVRSRKGKKEKTRTIQEGDAKVKLRKELKGLEKQWKSAKAQEKEGLYELREIVSNCVFAKLMGRN